MAEGSEDESGARSVCTDQHRRCPDWLYWYSRRWSTGGWNQSRRSCCSRKEDTGRRQQSTGNSTSTMRTTAEATEHGRRTPAGTREDAPAVQGLVMHKHTAQTQPFATCMSKRWQERQVLYNANTQRRKSGEIQKKVGRNGIMAKDHNWVTWSSLTTLASVHLGQKQHYNHYNTRSQLRPCISQVACGELHLEPRQHEDKQESLLEQCSKGRGIQDPEVPR